MAITYPRDLPACGVRVAALELVDNVAASQSGGGLMNLSQVVDPLWRLSLSTWTLRDSWPAEWAAWGKSLRGGFRRFLAVDSRRLRPGAYPQAQSPDAISAGWDGTADVTALGAGGVLSLTQLPVGYVIKAGDRIGLEQFNPVRRGYYEVIEGAVANGSGIAAVTVSPFLHTSIFTSAAVARLWQPKCEMTIDWKSWREEEGDLRSWASISFEAWQKL